MHPDFQLRNRSRNRLQTGSVAALFAVLLLSGCATFSPGAGMRVVADVAGEAIKKDVISIRTKEDAERAQEAVRRLVRQTLTVDSAVQVALLSNRGLQASYNELALAEADMVRESLPPNPTFSIFRIVGDDPHAAVRGERRASGKHESREKGRDMPGPDLEEVAGAVSGVEVWGHPSLLPIRLRRRGDAIILFAPR